MKGRGYVYGLTAPVCWGLAAIFVKLGLADGIPPVSGAFVAILVALPLNYLVVIGLLAGRPRKPLDRQSIALSVTAGVIMTIANLLYFVAISVENVSVAVPLSNTTPIFTLVLAFLFLRRERVTPLLVLGTLIIMLGVYLIAAR